MRASSGHALSHERACSLLNPDAAHLPPVPQFVAVIRVEESALQASRRSMLWRIGNALQKETTAVPAARQQLQRHLSQAPSATSLGQPSPPLTCTCCSAARSPPEPTAAAAAAAAASRAGNGASCAASNGATRASQQLAQQPGGRGAHPAQRILFPPCPVHPTAPRRCSTRPLSCPPCPTNT